ncbi:hypothetical protein MPH_07316 [Macrophomina phaseolina MS6]|uniref:Uncharacterized protein n=1 Tax=Macrophomina phaseolina (strain MS6) TaxID=1126212 RepID=K2RZ90_MACPH|nr:hypothetical protein MPH_07316 [Macrophomina phaseolina MS6]
MMANAATGFDIHYLPHSGGFLAQDPSSSAPFPTGTCNMAMLEQQNCPYLGSGAAGQFYDVSTGADSILHGTQLRLPSNALPTQDCTMQPPFLQAQGRNEDFLSEQPNRDLGASLHPARLQGQTWVTPFLTPICSHLQLMQLSSQSETR